ncbi:hypothetical protein [Brevundimonas diminuta]|uniref:hypothetical protein n=1 Tax=Brevundimonas diminuta TaxID=293 RepID=UPI00320B57D0
MKRIVATVVLAFSVGLTACNERSQAGPEAESALAATADASGDVGAGSSGASNHAAAPTASDAAPVAIKGAPGFAVIYPGGQADGQALTAAGPDGPGGIVTFTTDATPDAVIDFYRQRAERAGLDPIMAMNQGEARAYGASARSEKGPGLQVVAAPAEGGVTSVQLSWNGGA